MKSLPDRIGKVSSGCVEANCKEKAWLPQVYSAATDLKGTMYPKNLLKEIIIIDFSSIKRNISKLLINGTMIATNQRRKGFELNLMYYKF